MRLFLFSLFCALSLTGCPQEKMAPESETTTELAQSEAKAKPDTSTVSEDKLSASKNMQVDFSCTQDSDCAIKDVGSCCGQYPACVNKNSQTFPEQVQAECKKNDMMSTCGFPSISSCKCTNNRCEGVAGDGAEEVVR
jgi:hypothetical protein